MGVKRGDRVAAYLPNIPESVVAFLACSSIGAIWSSCASDFGSQSAIDRFKQVTPRVLITTDGYQYQGKVAFEDRRGRPAATLDTEHRARPSWSERRR